MFWYVQSAIDNKACNGILTGYGDGILDPGSPM